MPIFLAGLLVRLHVRPARRRRRRPRPVQLGDGLVQGLLLRLWILSRLQYTHSRAEAHNEQHDYEHLQVGVDEVPVCQVLGKDGAERFAALRDAACDGAEELAQVLAHGACKGLRCDHARIHVLYAVDEHHSQEERDTSANHH